MSLKNQLEREFGGSWDGPAERMHGLVPANRGTLKVDLVRRGNRYLCSVFADGACLASGRAATALEAVRDAFDAIDFRDSTETS